MEYGNYMYQIIVTRVKQYVFVLHIHESKRTNKGERVLLICGIVSVNGCEV